MGATAQRKDEVGPREMGPHIPQSNMDILVRCRYRPVKEYMLLPSNAGCERHTDTTVAAPSRLPRLSMAARLGITSAKPPSPQQQQQSTARQQQQQQQKGQEVCQLFEMLADRAAAPVPNDRR